MSKDYCEPTRPERQVCEASPVSELDEDQDLYGNSWIQSQLEDGPMCLPDEEAQVCEPAPLVCEPGNEVAEEAEATSQEEAPTAARRPEDYAPPTEATDEEMFAHYAEIARQNGNLFPIGPDGNPMPTVLGLRGIDVNGRVHDTENRRNANTARGQEGGYDDTLVILHPDGRIERMPYSSHPFQNNSGASPDVDRDGRGDVGTIRPGEYYARGGGSHAGDSSWHVRNAETTTDADGRVHMTAGNGHIPAWRDTNHDFRIDDAERADSERVQRGRAQNDPGIGDYADQVLFHQIRPGVRTDSSIACQVMPQDTFGDFKDDIGRRQDFNYVLVDVHDEARRPAAP